MGGREGEGKVHVKGLFTKKILSFKSHILDSNGVWYSFWSEGSINAQPGTRLTARSLMHRVEMRRGPLALRVEV